MSGSGAQPFPLFTSTPGVSTVADLDSAALVLADGTVFQGRSIGARGMAVGEVVFNTAMTGYQEILTDPSYFRQIVTLTYPHIGNTGVNGEDRSEEHTSELQSHSDLVCRLLLVKKK